tara:strand:- start:324 stop:1496 length:1173 start_codon:yes stop_codon:yes gene_type:complete
MSSEVTAPVEKRCATGKMPAWMRRMKSKNNYSCDELAGAVTSMVMDKRSRARTKMAGKKGDSNVLHLYGGDDWTWILATENDTRLRGLSGDKYLVDPIAHMAALPQWTKITKGHIDHKMDSESELEIGEARYDVDKGLYLKVRSDNPEISTGLKKGSILPSIEIDVENEDVLDNNIIDYYVPTGLGLMKDNEPMGNSVGPEKPNDRFSVPIYAGELDMTEEQEKETITKEEEVEAQAEPAAETPAEPEPVEEPKEEESVDELTAATTKVAELEKKLEEVLNQVDSKASAEEELKKMYLEKIPEALHSDVDTLDLATLKAFSKMSDHFQNQLGDATKLEEAPVINEQDNAFESGINADGNMSDKLYYSLKIKHAKANGMKYPEEWEKYLTV